MKNLQTPRSHLKSRVSAGEGRVLLVLSSPRSHLKSRVSAGRGAGRRDHSLPRSHLKSRVSAGDRWQPADKKATFLDLTSKKRHCHAFIHPWNGGFRSKSRPLTAWSTRLGPPVCSIQSEGKPQPEPGSYALKAEASGVQIGACTGTTLRC